MVLLKRISSALLIVIIALSILISAQGCAVSRTTASGKLLNDIDHADCLALSTASGVLGYI